MTISRMQQPRQLYGLGSLVKSVKKAVKKVAKSDLGKAALIAGVGFGVPGTTFGGLFGRAGFGGAATGLFGKQGIAATLPSIFGVPMGPPGTGSPSLFGKILGSKKGVAGLIGGASLLSGLFAGKTEEEVEELKRDPTALRNYLKLYYSNLNPNASSEEVDRFADANMYADGGRVGYAVGSPGPASPRAVPAGGPGAKTVAQLGSAQEATPLFQNVLQYLQRSGQQVTPKQSKQPQQPATSKPMPFDMSKYGQGTFTGGIEDTRNIALARLMGLGYDTSRFADPMGPPPGSSSGPMLIGPGMAAKFRDEENLAKLINPSYGMQLQTDVVGLLSMAKDIGENYTIDQALNFDKEDAMRIMDAYDKKNKYGKYAPRSSANILPKFPGTTTPPTSQFPTQRGTGSAGRGINYATGGSVVDKASGIMNLPKRVNKAGVKELDLRKSGGFIPPVGVKEKADDIPAMLSNNEFVFTADAVRGMGNGNVNLGAQRMYDMMKKLEKGGRV